jgi:hypothetical protein
MTDMIERVAKAVKNCGVFPLGDMREYLSPEDAITIARAAVEAMREPTDEMNDAGADKCDGGCAEESCQCGFMGKIWTAMIDAALEEKK